jgi:hypothetical protein
MTPEHVAAVRRHTTRARTELESIISTAQLLHKQLEKGQALMGDAQTLVTASVTVAERLAILETLSDVAEWEGGDTDVVRVPVAGKPQAR